MALLAHRLLDFVSDDCPAKVLDAVDFFSGEGSVYKAYCQDLTLKFGKSSGHNLHVFVATS